MLKKANRAFFNITLISAIAQKTAGFRAIALRAVRAPGAALSPRLALAADDFVYFEPQVE
jgi:hypothetical protein